MKKWTTRRWRPGASQPCIYISTTTGPATNRALHSGMQMMRE